MTAIPDEPIDGPACDVLVIGSGFAGSVVAEQVAAAGLAATVIERGPWRDNLPVRTLGIDHRARYPAGWRGYASLFWGLNHRLLPGGRMRVHRDGLFELFLGSGMDVLCSSNVGGGSHVYGGLLERPVDPHYWHGYPGLDPEEMEEHYRVLLDRFAARAPLPADALPNYAPGLFDTVPVVHSDARMQPAMGIAFPAVPGTARRVRSAEGVEYGESTYRGDGLLGTAEGAKRTADAVFLPAALRDGARVHALCEVRALDYDAARGHWCVDVRDRRIRRNRRLRGRFLVFAAGTMNTVRLLLRAREQHRDPQHMPALGRGFGGNGDVAGFWRSAQPDADFRSGLPCFGRIRVRTAHDSQDVVLSGLGALEQLPLPARLRRVLRSGLVLAAMGADAGDGCIRLQRGRLQVDYDAARSPVFARIGAAFRALAEATASPVAVASRPLTVHPYGGARLARSPAEGIVDATGRAFDLPNAYVADAAALPAACGGPPSLTVMAWARHVAGHVIAAGRR
ncbi:MAG: GMC family oxidoreductase [Gammaproteobacteria bacterium]|nr:GMC family oxidoreductase [Gammaproteobacteria bacterium]